MKRFHFIADFDNVKMPDDKDDQSTHILKWLDAILNVVDMQVIDGPRLKYGDGLKEGSQCGYSMTCIVDFSSVCLHHFEKDNQVSIDVFSCKPYNVKLVEEVCKNYFGKDIKFKMFIEV